MQFKKAERARAKARIGIEGVSGSGKTHSALLLAKGLVGSNGKIGLIDTEYESAAIEAGKPGIPDFQSLNLDAPYTPERYMEAIDAAEKAGLDCLIIDSLSHEWAGKGGITEIHTNLVRAGKNSFSVWADLTKRHNALIQRILASKLHVIATFRLKSDWVQEVNEKGKNQPKKVGMATVTGKDAEYEFTTMFRLSRDGNLAEVSKDRTIFTNRDPFVISEKTGMEIKDWLNSGAEVKVEPKVEDQVEQLISQASKDKLLLALMKLGYESISEACSEFGFNEEELTPSGAKALLQVAKETK